MKIIHLISGGDTGGAKTHIHYLLSGLARETSVLLVCFMEGDFAQEARELGIPTLVLEGSPGAALARLREIIKTGGYDIIHSHGARGNFMAAMLRRPCGLPMVSTIHSDPRLDYMGRPAARLVYGSLNAYSLRRADYMVGVSDSMRELLIRRGFKANSIFSIYNGVDFSLELSCPDRREYFARYGLDVREDSVVAGIAARLDPVKDVSTLIRGFALAEKNCPRLRLAIAGDGAETEKLRDLVRELGLEEKICFMGWLSDVNSFYAALDINVLSSLSETFPYAITEGARAGLATVSTRVGGVPKLVEDGVTGFLFSPGDAETLAGRLSVLAADDGLRTRLGRAIYDRAKRDFSVDATTRRQVEIYREILRREENRKKGQKHGVVICGAYGMGNAGDDAILEAIVNSMREIDPFMPITAFSRSPKETGRRFCVESAHMFNIPALRRVMKGTKLYISGGGSLIQNVTSRRSLWYYLHTISLAKKLGNKVMMYGCGIGPIVDSRDEKKLSRVLNGCVDIITLREDYSRGELERFGVVRPEIVVSSDPALSLSPAAPDRIENLMRRRGLKPDGRYAAFSVRSWTGFYQKAPAFAAAADHAARSLGATPVFVIINRQEDAAATEAVRRLMEEESLVVDELGEPAMTIGFLSRMYAVVSMRLHGLIFAASTGVPVVGVSYDPKVTAFLNFMGEDNCVSLDELEGPRLCRMLDKACREGEDSRGRLAVMEKLKAAERINISRARELLEK